jgi:hypothetical protein
MESASSGSSTSVLILSHTDSDSSFIADFDTQLFLEGDMDEIRS